VVLLSDMAQSNPALTQPSPLGGSLEGAQALSESTGPSTEPASWREIAQLLRRAAQLAAEHGAESDLFMQAAWAACLEARPGLREELADKELRAQLKKLRKRGLVAAA